MAKSNNNNDTVDGEDVDGIVTKPGLGLGSEVAGEKDDDDEFGDMSGADSTGTGADYGGYTSSAHLQRTASTADC